MSKVISGEVWYWCNYGKHFIPASDFNKSSSASSGLQSNCKRCVSLAYAANKEAIAAKRKERYRGLHPAKPHPSKRKTIEVNGEVLLWCNYNEHFAPETDFAKHIRYKKNGEPYEPKPKWICKPCQRLFEKSAERKAYIKSRRKERSEIHKRWRQKHPECARKIGRDRRARNPEHVRETENKAKRVWRLAHPETYKERNRVSKIRRRTAKGFYTEAGFNLKLEYWFYKCYLCGCPVTKETAHREHRIPVSRGGSNWIANIAPACQTCNLKKGDKTEAEFRALRAA